MANEITETQENRRPYSHDEFQGREGILEKIQGYLDEARAHKLKLALLSIVGVTGIGKTWVLSEIGSHYKREHNIRIGDRPTLPVYLNFEQVKKNDTCGTDVFCWYTQFLRSFVPALETASATRRPKELDILQQRKPESGLAPDELQPALNALNRWIDTLRQRYFPILLLDALEKIDASHLEWVEREVLAPLVEGNQALIITAGRHPVKWREPEMRFYSQVVHLGPLEQAVWEKQVPKWIHERYALGHPGLADKLREKFGELSGGLEGVRSLYQTPQEQEKVGPILREQINGVVLSEVSDRDIPREQMDLRSVLWTISVLRIFSPGILRAMVDEFGPSIYQSKSDLFFRQVAFDLIGAHVAAWRAGLNDYRVEPLVRRIMANAVRITNGSDAYLEQHKRAEEWYHSALENAPSTAPNKFPELLYHACVRIKSETKTTEALRELTIAEMQALLERYNLRFYKDDLDTLIHRMTNDDKDDDLDELRRDMLGVVGEDTFQELVNILQGELTTPELVPAT